jgi:peptide-methionine (S)-S-oxide reductase
MEDQTTNTEVAVFGGGCFWCTEAVFVMLRGVHAVLPGYAGGIKSNPTYEEVSSGSTGHAEVIKINYDPTQVSYRDLLTVFFGSHDPTTLNRQGADSGTQYRSIILTTSDAQAREAETFIKELNDSHKDGAPIVTEIKPLEQFYSAEEYHKNYYANNPEEGYCQLVINPKLDKVKTKFAELLNDAAKLK